MDEGSVATAVSKWKCAPVTLRNYLNDVNALAMWEFAMNVVFGAMVGWSCR